MKRIAAVVLVLCAASTFAAAQVQQSFPGVAPPVPAPPMLPVPPPVTLQLPAPSVARPPRTDSFSDRVRDCLHRYALPSTDATQQGRDRNSLVRECAN